MGGPAPKPTALKLLDGTRKDRINANEPKLPPGIPECPAHLNDIGRAKWFELVGQLDGTGVLTMADATGLEMLCSIYCEMRAATAVIMKIKKKPDIITHCSNGTPMKSQYLKVAQESRAALLTLLREFGLTPASRSKLSMTATGVDDLDEFL